MRETVREFTRVLDDGGRVNEDGLTVQAIVERGWQRSAAYTEEQREEWGKMKRLQRIAWEAVEGDWVELDVLANLLDNKALTKLHKLKPDELCDITGSLCSRISAKDCL